MGKTADPIVLKVAPPEKMRLCLTMRDALGSPLPGMALDVRQGVDTLRAVGGGALVTDASGRVVLDAVSADTRLTIRIDEAYVPQDSGAAKPMKYVYSVDTTGTAIRAFAMNGAEPPAGLDVEKAYLTAFASVNPFEPKYRFPWQNPVHRSEDKADDAIYAKRVTGLRVLLKSLFGVAGTEALDHDALVAKLIELHQANALPVGTPDDTPHVDPDQGSADQPPPPPSTPIADPPEATPPANVHVANLSVAPVPAPTPDPTPTPPAPPPEPVDPAHLPKWVWYLFFHYTGLRYTPHNADGSNLRTNGAHGSYFPAGDVLRLLRNAEITKQFADPSAMPSKEDVTEACALAFATFADKQARNARAALLSGKPKDVNAAIVSLFKTKASTAAKALQGMSDDAKKLNGDYFGLGLLRARHLKTPFPDGAWKAIVSHTPLRNDVAAAGWEVKPVAVTEFDAVTNKELQAHAADYWPTHHLQTLDLITNSAVCNQLSEIAEHARGNGMPGGIPANAGAPPLLRPVTIGNAPHIHRGMHFFYNDYRPANGKGQAYPNDTLPAEGNQWYLGRKPDELVDVSTLQELPGPASALIDPSIPVKKQNGVKAESVFTGYRLMTSTDVVAGRPAGDLLGFRGRAFLRIGQEAVPSKGASTSFPVLQVLVWTHQEIVIHVVKKGSDYVIYLWSTAADPGGNGGLGLRTFLIKSDSAAPSAVFGLARSSEKDQPAFDPIYLDSVTLRGA